MIPETTFCRSCGAKILWAKTVHNRTMPLDAEPVIGGTIRFDGEKAIVMKKAEILPGVALYQSHFVTCPNAQKHRKGGKDATETTG